MKINVITALITLLAITPAGYAQQATSLDEAVSQARDRFPGRIISAETRKKEGRATHNIRILSKDGRVRRFNVNADKPPRIKKRR